MRALYDKVIVPNCLILAIDERGIRVAPFVVEQPLFSRQTAAVAGKTAVSADDPVAGDDDAQSIVAAGAAAHRAYRGRPLGERRHLGVRAGAAGRHAQIGTGFESANGFRVAFAKVFGASPRASLMRRAR